MIFSLKKKQIISVFCKILAKKRSYQCKYIIIRKNAKKVRRCTVWPICFFPFCFFYIYVGESYLQERKKFFSIQSPSLPSVNSIDLFDCRSDVVKPKFVNYTYIMNSINYI